MNRFGLALAFGVAAFAVAACTGAPPMAADGSDSRYNRGGPAYDDGHDRGYDDVADSTAATGYDRRYDGGYQVQYTPTDYRTGNRNYPPDYGTDRRLPGRFAVYLENGGWDTRVKAQGDRCTGPRFKIMLDRLYQPTARDAFARNFEQVTFTDRPLRPEEIAAAGFDAQIIVEQGEVGIAFLTREDFFTDSISAYLAVEGKVAVVEPRGLVHEQRTEGAGRGRTDAVLCSDVDGAVTDAAIEVLNDFLTKAILQAQRDVQIMRGVSAVPRAAPAG